MVRFLKECMYLTPSEMTELVLNSWMTLALHAYMVTTVFDDRGTEPVTTESKKAEFTPAPFISVQGSAQTPSQDSLSSIW